MTLVLALAIGLTATTGGTSRTLLASGDDVGVVAEYRPATGRFLLQRSGQEVPVRIGTVVQAGDRVSLPPGAAVIIQLASGKPLTLEATATVPASPAVGRLAAFFRSIPALFDAEFRQARTAASRGPGRCENAAAGQPITVPLLVERAALMARTRDIPLVWLGGCTPYAVVLLRGSDTVGARHGVEGPQVRLDDTRLEPGVHRLVITDDAGQRFEGTLDAVEELPEFPAELREASLDLGIIAQALWLAQQDGGRWRLDGFELLRPLIRAGNPLAGAVADGVLWGRY